MAEEPKKPKATLIKHRKLPTAVESPPPAAEEPEKKKIVVVKKKLVVVKKTPTAQEIPAERPEVGL